MEFTTDNICKYFSVCKHTVNKHIKVFLYDNELHYTDYLINNDVSDYSNKFILPDDLGVKFCILFQYSGYKRNKESN
jgi:hypothetical protein